MTFETILLATLFSVGGILFLLERVPSLQRQRTNVSGRWMTNLGLLIIGGVVLALFFPVDLYATAAMQPPGLLSSLEISTGIQIVCVFLVLDFWRYWEHRIFHRVSLLWRAHLVHHSDTLIDVTTAERHHPLEALVTTPLALMLVFVLSLPAEGIAVYLLVATVSALWVHSNLRIPVVVDSALRIFVVTPAVHAIHHSSTQQQTDSNYGSVLTIWDRLFGTYTNPVDARVKYFGLEYFHQARDRTLTRAMLQPLLYRAGMTHVERETVSEQVLSEETIVLSQAWQKALLYGGLGLVLVMLAMWPTFTNLVSVWSSSEPYQYAWLVLPFLIYVLGWHYRDEVLSLTPQSDLLGVAIIVGAIGLWMMAAIVQIDLGMYVAFVLVLQGILIATLGRHIWWQWFPVFALLFFMIPSGDVLQLPLRMLTVMMIDWFASAVNLPHSIEGFVIYIGEQRYVVVDACSGLTFVTLATFLGYCWGVLLYRSFPKIACLALLGALLGIGANAIRVNMIVWLDWINGTEMELTGHSDIQMIVLLFLLGALFLIVSRLQPESYANNKPFSGNMQETRQDIMKYTPIVAGLLVASTVGLTQLIMSAEADSHLSTASLAPVDSTTFSTTQPSVSWAVDEASRTGSLALALKDNLDVLVVQALPGNMKLPESWLIPRGDNDWREVNIENQSACLQENCINFKHTTWNRSGSDDVRHIFYTYHVGDLVTDSKLNYRLAAGWNRLMGANHQAGFISFFSAGDPPTPKQLADAYLQIKAKI